jgi:hypothetical protein
VKWVLDVKLASIFSGDFILVAGVINVLVSSGVLRLFNLYGFQYFSLNHHLVLLSNSISKEASSTEVESGISE